MISKEALEKWYGTISINDKIRWKDNYLSIKKDLEVMEIIKRNPELVWWCCCYETAEQMIIDRKGFMLDYSIEEIREQFNKVKEWLNGNN